MTRRLSSLPLLGAAVLLPVCLALGQDAPQRDPFKTPPAIKRAARRKATAGGKATPTATPSLRSLLLLRGKKPGALLRIGEESFVVRANDAVTAGGRSWTVSAIDASGVTLSETNETQPLRLTLR